MAVNGSEKGSPNRNRTSVAPQGPAVVITPRCSALRPTWKIDAATVAGIQRREAGMKVRGRRTSDTDMLAL